MPVKNPPPPDSNGQPQIKTSRPASSRNRSCESWKKVWEQDRDEFMEVLRDCCQHELFYLSLDETQPPSPSINVGAIEIHEPGWASPESGIENNPMAALSYLRYLTDRGVDLHGFRLRPTPLCWHVLLLSDDEDEENDEFLSDEEAWELEDLRSSPLAAIYFSRDTDSVTFSAFLPPQEWCQQLVNACRDSLRRHNLRLHMIRAYQRRLLRDMQN